MEVKIKDREKEIEYLRMALNMCGLGVNYQNADLIHKLTKELRVKKGNFDTGDASRILCGWEEKWEEYFEVSVTNKNKE